jgi:uncharacterized protein YecT (DUF1311 family)
VRVITAIGLFIILILMLSGAFKSNPSPATHSISSTTLIHSEDAGRETVGSLVPRGNEKPSFDCAKARAASARLICADAELALLDGELGGAFNERRLQTAAAERAKVVDSQLAWVKDRNKRCGLEGNNAALEALASSKPCLVTALRERIAFLSPDEAPLTLHSAPTPAEQVTESDAPKSIVVSISIVATPTNPPALEGTTNLPDGTPLTIYLRGDDPSACFPRCGLGFDPATVQGGRFAASLGVSTPIAPGSWTVDVFTPMAGLQPEKVQAVIGRFGEHLRGPYVQKFEEGKGLVPFGFPRSTDPTDKEMRFGGLTIHYTQKIQVVGSAPSENERREQLASKSYKSVTVKDLLLDRKAYAASQTGVAVSGFYRLRGPHDERLYTSYDDFMMHMYQSVEAQYIALITETGSRPMRESLMDCGARMGCDVTIVGHLSPCVESTAFGGRSDALCLVAEVMRPPPARPLVQQR